MCVPKNLANHSADMVLLYNVASHRSCEGSELFWRKVQLTSQDKSPPENKSFLFLYKTKVESGGGWGQFPFYLYFNFILSV